MSWTDPRTWVTDEIVTSSLMNTHVRDNLKAISHPYDYAPADVDVANTVAETSVYSKVITGNDLGSNGLMRLLLVGDFLHNNSGNDNITLRLKFGGVTVLAADMAFNITVGANRQPWRLDVVVGNKGATNSQVISGLLFTAYANTGAPSTGMGNIAQNSSQPLGILGNTSSIDTTTNQTLQVTVQWTAASANNSWRKRLAFLELGQN